MAADGSAVLFADRATVGLVALEHGLGPADAGALWASLWRGWVDVPSVPPRVARAHERYCALTGQPVVYVDVSLVAPGLWSLTVYWPGDRVLAKSGRRRLFTVLSRAAGAVRAPGCAKLFRRLPVYLGEALGWAVVPVLGTRHAGLTGGELRAALAALPAAFGAGYAAARAVAGPPSG